MEASVEVINQRIKHWEDFGYLDPNCKMCQEIFYPAAHQGKMIGDIFAPRHKAMDTCRSGKYPHCTCDTCF